MLHNDERVGPVSAKVNANPVSMTSADRASQKQVKRVRNIASHEPLRTACLLDQISVPVGKKTKRISLKSKPVANAGRITANTSIATSLLCRLLTPG